MASKMLRVMSEKKAEKREATDGRLCSPFAGWKIIMEELSSRRYNMLNDDVVGDTQVRA